MRNVWQIKIFSDNCLENRKNNNIETNHKISLIKFCVPAYNIRRWHEGISLDDIQLNYVTFDKFFNCLIINSFQ